MKFQSIRQSNVGKELLAYCEGIEQSVCDVRYYSGLTEKERITVAGIINEKFIKPLKQENQFKEGKKEYEVTE